jgi:hypothetical protein
MNLKHIECIEKTNSILDGEKHYKKHVVYEWGSYLQEEMCSYSHSQSILEQEVEASFNKICKNTKDTNPKEDTQTLEVKKSNKQGPQGSKFEHQLHKAITFTYKPPTCLPPLTMSTSTSTSMFSTIDNVLGIHVSFWGSSDRYFSIRSA